MKKKKENNKKLNILCFMGPMIFSKSSSLVFGHSSVFLSYHWECITAAIFLTEYISREALKNHYVLGLKCLLLSEAY